MIYPFPSYRSFYEHPYPDEPKRRPHTLSLAAPSTLAQNRPDLAAIARNQPEVFDAAVRQAVTETNKKLPKTDASGDFTTEKISWENHKITLYMKVNSAELAAMDAKEVEKAFQSKMGEIACGSATMAPLNERVAYGFHFTVMPGNRHFSATVPAGFCQAQP